MAAIAASSVSIAPARVAAARQSRSRARAAVVVKASADERRERTALESTNPVLTVLLSWQQRIASEPNPDIPFPPVAG